MNWFNKKTPHNHTIYTSENKRWTIRRLEYCSGWNLRDNTKQGSEAVRPYDTLAEAKKGALAAEQREFYMKNKLYNVFGTYGREDRNYHVIADTMREAKQLVRQTDSELKIVSASLETEKVFDEMGYPKGAYQQAVTEAHAHKGIYLYDCGT